MLEQEAKNAVNTGMAYEQIYIYFIWQIKKPKIML